MSLFSILNAVCVLPAGILYGTMTLELGGKVTIECEKTKCFTELEFKLKVAFTHCLPIWIFPSFTLCWSLLCIVRKQQIIVKVFIFTPFSPAFPWRLLLCESDQREDFCWRGASGYSWWTLGKSFNLFAPASSSWTINKNKYCVVLNMMSSWRPNSLYTIPFKESCFNLTHHDTSPMIGRKQNPTNVWKLSGVTVWVEGRLIEGNLYGYGSFF